MRRTVRHAIASLVLSITLGAPTLAGADGTSMPSPLGPLRPEWSVERPAVGRARVVGYLYNDNGVRNAHNVWLRVEQLSAGGAVEKIYQRRIMGDVLSRNRVSFDVAVTEANEASTYRVLVESADWFMECR